MFSAETPENIRSYRLWRTETDRECRVCEYFHIVKLKDHWCSLVLPEGQAAFCFSASQRKAKKRVSLRPSRLERVNASGRRVYVQISMTSLVSFRWWQHPCTHNRKERCLDGVDPGAEVQIGAQKNNDWQDTRCWGDGYVPRSKTLLPRLVSQDQRFYRRLEIDVTPHLS